MLKLFDCKTPMGGFYIYCETKEIAMKIFRERFSILEVTIEEITERHWIASPEAIMSVVGHSFGRNV